MTSTLNAHQFLSDSAFYLPDTEPFINLTSEVDQPYSSFTQQTPKQALHPEQTPRRNALHQLPFVDQHIAELYNPLAELNKRLIVTPFEVFDDVQWSIDPSEDEATVLDVEILLVDEDDILVVDHYH